MDIHTFITCLIAVTLLTLTPGLDTLLVIRNSARGGRMDGMVSSFGICSGLFVHASVSALGISLLLMQTAWAFQGLKLAGAGYLVWLGISGWRRAIGNRGGVVFSANKNGNRGFNGYRSFREGFLSNVLNPKTVVFYLAFLPQFIDPAGSPLVQSLLVASIHFSVAMVYQCVLAFMVERAVKWLQQPRVGRCFDALTGSLMMYLGGRLLFYDS